MAHDLDIIYGSTTLHLTASGINVMHYVPRSDAAAVDKVLETVEIKVVNTTYAAMQASLAALSKALQRASDYARTKIGDRVYLTLTLDGVAGAWRSEILGGRDEQGNLLDGRLILDNQALDYAYWIHNKLVKASLVFYRRNYWEGAEAQIPLTNLTGTDNTSGLTIFNPTLTRTAATISFVQSTQRIQDSANGLASFTNGMVIRVAGSQGTPSNNGSYLVIDGGHAGYIGVDENLMVDEAAGATITISGSSCNYADIDGDDVAGDLPGATRLEITNTYASLRLSRVWIGQNWTDPANAVHILEGEDATGGTTHAAAYSSGGNDALITLSSGSETDLLSWTLTAEQMDAWKGNYYRAMLRFGLTSQPDIKFRLKIDWNVTTIWQSQQITLPSAYALQIRDLIAFRLPPWLPGSSGLDAVQLILTGQQTTGYDIPFYVDCLALMPLDGWRYLAPIGYGTAQNARIVDDGINGKLYRDAGDGTGKVGIYIGYGDPIRLKPGVDQRLYFMMHSYQGDTAEIARTATVKLFHRPWKQTL